MLRALFALLEQRHATALRKAVRQWGLATGALAREAAAAWHSLQLREAAIGARLRAAFALVGRCVDRGLGTAFGSWRAAAHALALFDHRADAAGALADER